MPSVVIDRRLPDVDEQHVVAIERRVIVGVDWRAFRSDWQIDGWAEAFGHLRILDDFMNLVAHEVRHGAVGVLIDGDPLVSRQQGMRHAALFPALFQPSTTLLRRFLMRKLRGQGKSRHGGEGVSGLLAPFGVPVQKSGLLVRRQRSVARRRSVVRHALEDRQVPRLGGDDGDGLNAGRAGPDDADPQAGEVDLLRAAKSRCGTTRPRIPPARETAAETASRGCRSP